MERIIGLDFGSKTTGVAVSDPFGWTAQGVEIIRRKEENKLRKTLARIEELVKEYGAARIVLGLPKNMNNTIGPKGELSYKFKQMLEEKIGINVFLMDERLTTKQATDILLMNDTSRKKRKKVIDSMAATIILQSYLDKERNK